MTDETTYEPSCEGERVFLEGIEGASPLEVLAAVKDHSCQTKQDYSDYVRSRAEWALAYFERTENPKPSKRYANQLNKAKEELNKILGEYAAVTVIPQTPPGRKPAAYR